MDYKDIFIKSNKEFEKIRNILNHIFFFDNLLPDQVFHNDYNNFLFKEFDFTMSEDFWNEIKHLANKTNDDFIIMAVLNPNPKSYYYKEFGYYNWAMLDVNISPSQYLDILNICPKDSPADSIFSNSFTIVFASPSMKWAIWAEREEGVCVVAFNSKISYNSLISTLKGWRPFDNIVIDWIGINYKNFTLPSKIKDKLLKNYK